MSAVRTNNKIERNALVTDNLLGQHIAIVPCIQNGYFAAPSVTEDVDYSTFKKLRVEKQLLKKLKKENKAGRIQEFGSEYKNHLNISENKIVPTLHFTF